MEQLTKERGNLWLKKQKLKKLKLQKRNNAKNKH